MTIVVCVKIDPDGRVLVRRERAFRTHKKARIFADAMLAAGYKVEITEGEGA